MSVRFKNNWAVIKLIAFSKSTTAYNIIKELSNNQIQSICELAINTFYGNIKVSSSNKEKLQVYKKSLVYLSNNLHTIQNKKKYMLKNVLFLQLLIKCVNNHISIIVKDNENEVDRKENCSSMESVSSTDKE